MSGGALAQAIRTRRARMLADPLYVRASDAYFSERARFGGADYTLEQYVELWMAPCYLCGKDPAEGVDHIHPKARGGVNTLANLAPCCIACNRVKGARVPALSIELREQGPSPRPAHWREGAEGPDI